MSYDLTLLHAPKLRKLRAAMARLDAETRPGARERARLLALAASIQAALGPECWSIDPVVDEDRGCLGLCLTSRGADRVQDTILPIAAAAGFAVWDPQEGVFYYADGSSSREEQLVGGVHEGVDICLRELADPKLALSEKLDALDALKQFALGDSADRGAAVGRSVPVLLDLLADPALFVRARLTLMDLADGLIDEAVPLSLDAATRGRILATDDALLASLRRLAEES